MRLMIEEDGELWAVTEFRNGNLSVAQIIKKDPEYSVPREHVGKWRVTSPIDPERIAHATPGDAMRAAVDLERIADEARA